MGGKTAENYMEIESDTYFFREFKAAGITTETMKITVTSVSALPEN